METLGGKYKEQLIEAINKNKTFRIVGDNINWTVGVHDERQDNKGHMQHAFGSASIVQNICYEHLPNVNPQKDFCTTPVQAFFAISRRYQNFTKGFHDHNRQGLV